MMYSYLFREKYAAFMQRTNHGSSSPVSNNLPSTMIWASLSCYQNEMLNFSSVQYFIYWWRTIMKQVHTVVFVLYISQDTLPPKKWSVVLYFRMRIQFIRSVRQVDSKPTLRIVIKVADGTKCFYAISSDIVGKCHSQRTGRLTGTVWLVLNVTPFSIG